MLELVYVSLAMFCPPIIAIASAFLTAELVDKFAPMLTAPPASYVACPRCHYNLEGHHLASGDLDEHEDDHAEFESEMNDGFEASRDGVGRTADPNAVHGNETIDGTPVHFAGMRRTSTDGDMIDREAVRSPAAPDADVEPSAPPLSDARWPITRRLLNALRIVPSDRGERPPAPPLTIISTHCPECGAFVTHPDLVPLNDFAGRRPLVWAGRLLIAAVPAGILPPWFVYSLLHSFAEQTDAVVVVTASLLSIVLAIAAVVGQCLAILLLTSVLDWRFCREEASGWIGMAIVLNTAAIWVAFVITSVVLLAV